MLCELAGEGLLWLYEGGGKEKSGRIFIRAKSVWMLIFFPLGEEKPFLNINYLKINEFHCIK